MAAKPAGAIKFARGLRRRQTPDEEHLWRLLKDSRLAEFKFRRQVPIGIYFADFACYDRRLVVELDGSQHAGSARDKVRDAELDRRGFAVLRVWNSDLRYRRDGVLNAIWHALQVQEAPSSVSASPSHLLPRGEKGSLPQRLPPLPSPLVGEGARRADEGVAT